MCRSLLVAILAILAQGPVANATDAADPPSEISVDDARAGWISLFDRESMFGWAGASVQDGALRGGATTTPFGPIEIRAEVVNAGELSVGGVSRRVPVGLLRESFDVVPAAPVRLGRGLALRGISVRPVQMTPAALTRPGTDWTVIPHPSLPKDRQANWSPVESGGNVVGLRAVGGPGCVELPGLYGDFLLQLDVTCHAPGANAGVFFRSRPGDFLNGYEAQIFNATVYGNPPRQVRYFTGAIDDRRGARRLVSRDGEPFTLTIVAAGPRLATWVNGVRVTDWIDERKPHDNPRQGLRVEPGTIQLQAHDKGTDVEFTNIRVAPLK